MFVFIKKTIKLIMLIFLFFQYQPAFPLEIEEKLFPADFKILSITQDLENEYIYIGGKSSLYLLTRSKLTKLMIPAGIKEVRSICVTKNYIYGVFDEGLFVKNLNEEGQFWQRKFDVVNAEGVELFDYDKDKIVIWNKKNVYIADLSGADKLKGVTGEENIIKIKTIKNSIFILTDRTCIIWDKNLNVCRKILSELFDIEELSGNDENLSGNFIPDIDVDSSFAVLSTLSGVYVFEHKTEKLKKISVAGVPVSAIKHVAINENNIFISTFKKLYTIGKNGFGIKEIYLRNEIVDLSVLYSGISYLKHMNVWIGGENRLFRVELSGQDFENKKFYKNKSEVISIKEVQEMAIQYAEVSPEKINKWRKASKFKAILPKVSLGLSESNDENIEIYKSASTYYVVNGPREVDRDWSIDLSWDLSDLIWNNEQTSIDVRSKLMVQLRNDILEEVTRLYFERMRLVGELDMISDDSNQTFQKKKMRVQEITAYIDAYTGGKFSENIFLNNTEIGSK